MTNLLEDIMRSELKKQNTKAKEGRPFYLIISIQNQALLNFIAHFHILDVFLVTIRKRTIFLLIKSLNIPWVKKLIIYSRPC